MQSVPPRCDGWESRWGASLLSALVPVSTICVTSAVKLISSLIRPPRTKGVTEANILQHTFKRALSKILCIIEDIAKYKEQALQLSITKPQLAFQATTTPAARGRLWPLGPCARRNW